ncbi:MULTISPECIES: hypothetical protein [Streptomyces]|uniref:Secreted protein n=1 Tax=Streptomyces lycii TaxID=2654337 RepID=A0ABQ7FPU0_9ACTN|nr:MULTISPECIES: hypothetical protein [Streptomyces]KAF4410949.1 hypothetical protein GCU69_01125 [Streptomyces lycii]PGH48472.1 hypothetical protein CRI70_22970 [Streptomyces sp. Ru87]
MSIRHTAKARRGAAAVAFAVGLLVAVAGCGGNGEESPDADSSQQSSEGGKSGGDSGEGRGESEAPEQEETIAELRGPDEIVLSISSAKRDAGGFVTVSGAVKNDGQKDFYKTAEWRGNEKEILGNGHSLGGAALIDNEGKKRYYVLRDTEGRCLCTTGITAVGAGETVPVFAQFPSPPEGTSEVEFTLPTFDAATVEISPSE